MERRRLLGSVAAGLRDLRQVQPVRVAVDGPDAAGKTTFADELAAVLAPHRPVTRLSIDDFHHPPEIRARRGQLSAEGYYLDAFDLPAVRTALDRAVTATAAGAIVVVDGVFLHRAELGNAWDLAVYLHIDPEETLRRALVRDLELFGDEDRVVERYTHRYLPAQALYRERDRPLERSHLVVDHTDPADPRILTDRR
jgi:uridine kinase